MTVVGPPVKKTPRHVRSGGAKPVIIKETHALVSTAPADGGAKEAARLLDLGVTVGAGSTSAAREITAHAHELGVSLQPGVDIVKSIQEAELMRGQAADERVGPPDMQRAIVRSQKAWRMAPVAQRALFGFTRVVDAKVTLTPAALEALAQAAIAEDPRAGTAALLAAIDRGPPGGGLVFSPPASALELVASLVRQMVKGAGASRQLTLTPTLAAWVEQTLASAGAEPKKAMGGAGAFASNLAAALGIDSTFFAADPVPGAIAERFAPGVKLVDKQGTAHAPRDHQADMPARINTSVEYLKGLPLSLFGATSVRVDGADVPFIPGGAGRVILGAQAKDIRPGLHDVDDRALTQIARDSDLFFFVGAHYLTQAEGAAQAAADAAQMAASLAKMKAANPQLLIHAQYVVPKKIENEAVVWAGLKGALDSLALNAVEVAPFVDSLHDAGLADLDLDENVPRSAAEDPLHMLEGALALARALALPRIHLHGFEGDLVVSRPGMPGADDPERQMLALVRARQLAANKATNDSGEVKTPDDVWEVVPSVQGTGLAAVHRFADAISQKYGLAPREREQIVERWWFKDEATGTVIHFVPSRGIHDRTGGTVSLGDTIDATALLFARAKARAPRIKHGSSFT